MTASLLYSQAVWWIGCHLPARYRIPYVLGARALWQFARRFT